MRFLVLLEGRVEAKDDSEIEGVIDATMEELIALEALDPSIDFDRSSCAFRFRVEAEAANPIVAVEHASGVLRSAIHAAGGSTPDWPDPLSEVWGIYLTSTQSEPVDHLVSA